MDRDHTFNIVYFDFTKASDFIRRQFLHARLNAFSIVSVEMDTINFPKPDESDTHAIQC